jgi:hypothetical protein
LDDRDFLSFDFFFVFLSFDEGFDEASSESLLDERECFSGSISLEERFDERLERSSFRSGVNLDERVLEEERLSSSDTLEDRFLDERFLEEERFSFDDSLEERFPLEE